MGCYLTTPVAAMDLIPRPAWSIILIIKEVIFNQPLAPPHASEHAQP
jgi:hypothetical protein